MSSFSEAFLHYCHLESSQLTFQMLFTFLLNWNSLGCNGGHVIQKSDRGNGRGVVFFVRISNKRASISLFSRYKWCGLL